MHLSKHITASTAKQLEGRARADAWSKRQVDDEVKKKEGRMGQRVVGPPVTDAVLVCAQIIRRRPLLTNSAPTAVPA